MNRQNWRLCTCHRLPRGRGGGGGTGLMWGLCLMCISSYFASPPVGDFLLAKSPVYLAKPSTQLDLKMHLRALFWFFEQLANTQTFLNTSYLNSKVNFFNQTLYHSTTTNTLTQLKGDIYRYSSKTVVLWKQSNWERRCKLIKAVLQSDTASVLSLT